MENIDDIDVKCLSFRHGIPCQVISSLPQGLPVMPWGHQPSFKRLPARPDTLIRLLTEIGSQLIIFITNIQYKTSSPSGALPRSLHIISNINNNGVKGTDDHILPLGISLTPIMAF